MTCGLVGAAPGTVTAIKRSGSVLDLDVHFHTLVPDGVFVADGAGGARFVPCRPDRRRGGGGLRPRRAPYSSRAAHVLGLLVSPGPQVACVEGGRR